MQELEKFSMHLKKEKIIIFQTLNFPLFVSINKKLTISNIEVEQQCFRKKSNHLVEI